MNAAKKQRRDTTDQDPTWCTVNLHITKDALEKQCEHTDSRGRYVVKIKTEWHGFDPSTRMQALAWINDREERNRQIHWVCFTCGEIMPLGSYEQK